MLPKSSRPILSVFFALVGLYGIILSGFLLIRRFFGDRQPVIGLFNVFAPLLMLPALPLILVSLAFQRYWLVLTQIVPVAGFLTSYAGRFLPKRKFAPATSSELRVLTYNIHKYARGYIDSVITVIREFNADIVALQELSPEAADAITAQLAGYYPYRALHPMEKAACGQGILSRYPITADEYWRNAQVAFTLGHQRVEIVVNGSPVTVYNTHPAHPGMSGTFYNGEPHRREMDILLGRAERDTSPVLIVGDFNMSDQSDDYRWIASRYADSYHEAGWGMGFTFPDLSQPHDLPAYIPRTRLFPPLIRLDYIFHSYDFQALEAGVWPSSGGSDHRPVFARLALRCDERC